MRQIVGRVSDIVRVKGRFIVPKQVASALRTVSGIGPARLIIERPGAQDVITVAVERGNSELHDEVLRSAVVAALKTGIGLGCDVNIVKSGEVGGETVVIDDRRAVERAS
jgi:phenylacetate-coenzyme A ligase PaaK-like adenylate-forming protein